MINLFLSLSNNDHYRHVLFLFLYHISWTEDMIIADLNWYLKIGHYCFKVIQIFYDEEDHAAQVLADEAERQDRSFGQETHDPLPR